MEQKQTPPRDEAQGKGPDLSRRKFLIGTGAGAAMIGIGALAASHEGKAFLRPPGGQDELSFLAKCIRCDRCRSICPTSAIGVASVEESILAARTPVMKYRIGFCDFCGRCVEVCPTCALTPFDVRSVKIGIAQVTDRCLALNGGVCTVCGRECSYDAISFGGEGRPIIDASRCNGCGVCEKVCPALVLRSYSGGTLRGIVVKPLSKRGV